MRSVCTLSIWVCILTLCVTTMAKKKIKHPHNMFMSGKRGFSWNRMDGDNLFRDSYQDDQDQLRGNLAQHLRVTGEDETERFLAKLIKEKLSDPSGKTGLNQYEFTPLEYEDWYPPQNALYRNI